MRLLLVSAAHEPSHGGIGTAVSLVATRATQAGWHIELMTRPGPHLPSCARVHIVGTKDMRGEFQQWIEPLRQIHRIRPYRYGLWSLAVAEKILEIGGAFDAIEFVDSQAEGFVSLTSRRVREHWHSTPMYVHAHTPMWLIDSRRGVDEQQFGRATYHDWERRGLAAADGVRAPSRLLLNAIGAKRDAAVIPHLLPNESARARAAYHTLLFIGNIEPNKGPDVWARSLNVVLRKFPDSVACMVGTDTCTAPDGGSMACNVQSLIATDVRQRFKMHGGIGQAQLAALLSRAAVVAVPSRFESFSYVAAEAIMRNVPVIVTDQVGITEYTTNMQVVPVDDHAALANAQCEILADPAAAARRAAMCREELLQACNPENGLARVEQFVSSLKPQSNVQGYGTTDSIVEMADYLASIERQIGMHAQERGLIHAAADRS
jgi:glycosyltransferase involved in cell wall biosynthesis